MSRTQRRVVPPDFLSFQTDTYKARYRTFYPHEAQQVVTPLHRLFAIIPQIIVVVSFIC
jgi:hypothetical protein